MLTTLQGEVERITYASEDHTFVIAKLRIKGRKDLITIVGNVLVPAPGEQITVTGEWTTHPFYGSQFKVHSYAVTAPATISGIEKYLGSGLIKGIGPQLAKRIVHHFGSRTFEIIEKSPALLTQVAGIGDGRAGLIQEAWTAQHEIREVMVFLQSHGVSSRYAAKIFKTYGKQSIAVVQENPYRLAMDIPGIGFLAADHIAEGLGFDKGSPLRAESGILYVLGMLAGEGNVYYPLEPLVDRCRQMLQIPEGTLIDALSALASRQKVIIEDISCSPLNKRPHRAVFLAAYYNSEATIAHRLATILAAPQSTAAEALSQAISQSRKHISIVLSPLQIQALNCAAHSKMTIITGGPGTGKTTLIAALLLIFSAAGSRILLAAPTGRAAKRMTEATGIDAKTIHRLLEYSLRDGGFQKNEHNPLCCDVLIVDEASMIDTLLMYHLVQAIPAEATIILVGDINQLPSVGPGTVLKDMIAAGIAPVVELREVFRQAQESRIVTNAHKVNSGQLPVIAAGTGK